MPEKPKKRPRDSAATLSQFMMPEHSNPTGQIHGGLIMKMIDEAAAIAAMRHAQRPVLTVVVDSVTFRSPVHVGQLLTLNANVTYVGRTSMEVEVHVVAEDPVRGTVTHTNSAFLVFVALDDAQRPTEVPGLLLESDEEHRAWEQGAARQAHRLRRVP
ncbi:MAG: hypothetical protein RJA70_3278 [Pseudomonadota bacterium]|jgi:uncharacterized protein (TIGR00369 family)